VSLLDDIASVGVKSNECTVGRLLKELPTKESEALLKAIDNTDTSMAMLARVLESHGHNIHRKSLLRHRKRGQKESGCVCK
jgi:Lon protease-like protein